MYTDSALHLHIHPLQLPKWGKIEMGKYAVAPRSLCLEVTHLPSIHT